MSSFFPIVHDLPGFPVVFSRCKNYRYTLWRTWTRQLHPRYVVWVGLNPSTATATKNDPTITRCIHFSKAWGFEAMCMLNLFAFRASKPVAMKKAIDPIGPDNNHWIKIVLHRAELIVPCWGAAGKFKSRDQEIYPLLKRSKIEVKALLVNSNGTPTHPLFVPANTIPCPY